MLINAEGKVWVGQRLDSRLEAWQMPQGGLDPGEEPPTGALRELEEETGIGPGMVEIVARHGEELYYDLPEELAGKLWKGRGAASARPGSSPGSSAPTPTSTSPPPTPNSGPGNGPTPPTSRR